jgi:hypoxanthine phosphoribosyltransferase
MEEQVQEVYSAAEIADRVRALAAEITQAYDGRELAILGVLDDGFVFLADLLRAIKVPVRTAFLRFRHNSLAGVQDLSFNTEMDLTGRDVLLVEGVLDTGVTQEYLIKQLESRGATSIKLCVLLDKPDNRRVGLKADWRAFEASDGYLFGYGLGFQERWRELPFLATLVGEHEDTGSGA